MTSRQLPEEVEKLIVESAKKKFPGSELMSGQTLSIVGLLQSGFEKGATAALTDPSIFEAAGLVKNGTYKIPPDDRDEKWMQKYNECLKSLQAAIKELEQKLNNS